jgi:hypothetical protein
VGEHPDGSDGLQDFQRRHAALNEPRLLAVEQPARVIAGFPRTVTGGQQGLDERQRGDDGGMVTVDLEELRDACEVRGKLLPRDFPSRWVAPSLALVAMPVTQ